jgi:hypothetical protein
VRLESSVNLIVATLDLQLVRLVRDAMRAADGAQGAGLIRPAPVVEPRHRHQPEPVIEPRLRHRPAPVIEPPMKMRSGDAVWAYTQCVSPVTEPVSTENVSRSTSPIEPPWKVLPWENRPLPAPRVVRNIKVIVGRPDIQSKGNVIDLFI